MDQDIIEKLKKLLRLGQSSNPHEAELAIERAFELAAKHNIDLAGVDVDEETRRILHKRFKVGERLSLARKLAILVVHNYFNVHAIVDRPEVILIGTESDVEIAFYIVDFLIHCCLRCLRSYENEHLRRLTTNKKKNYIAGFFYGMSHKLDGSREQMLVDDSKTALITAEEARRKKYQEEHLDFKTHSLRIDTGRRNRDALIAGYSDGKDTDINKAVSGKKTEGRLLTA